MAENVLHQHSGPNVTWSRVNMAESVVGVQTPLSWCCWDEMGERAFRLGYRQLRLVPESFLEIPASIDQQFTAVFYGQGACNLDAFRVALAAMPGNARDAAEEGFFASQGNGRRDSVTTRRRITVRVWLPLYALSVPRRLARIRDSSRSRWHAALAELPTADRALATRRLHEAIGHAADEIAAQIAVSTLTGMAHGAIQALLARTGHADLEMKIIGSPMPIFASSGFWSLIFLSCAYAGILFQQPTLCATTVDIGKGHVGAVFGFMNTASNVSSAVSSVVFGYLVAYSGGYELPFIPMLVLLCVGIVLWLKVDPTQRVIPEDPPLAASHP